MHPSLRSITRRALGGAAAAALTLLSISASAQTTGSVGIGTNAPAASALLDLTSVTQGLLTPRMTASERLAIMSPAKGLLVYQTDGVQLGFWYHNGAAWVYLNPTPFGDDLGNHSATRALTMNGNAINFGNTLTQHLNLWGTDYGIGVQPYTLAFRSAGGFAWYKGGSYAANENDPGAGGSAQMILGAAGNLGLGLAQPLNRLDVSAGTARVGSHAANRPLYITGDFNAADNGAEFRHYNGTQGVGIGYNSLYAAGSNADQPLNLMPKGSAGVGIGTTSPTQKLQVAGQIYSSSGGFRFPDNSVQTTAAAADNLGNHTATQNLNLAANKLVGNGGTNGLSISSGGSVGIGGTTTPNAKAALEVSSTTQGFLPPRLSKAQRDALLPTSTEKGLLVFNTDSGTLTMWNGAQWVEYLPDNTPPGSGPSPLAPVAFSFTGTPQTYNVPLGVTRLTVELIGAGGGSPSGYVGFGGYGGKVQGTLSVTPGQVITVYVGGTNGFNGGGASGGGTYAGNGGGASDLRVGGTSLADRVVVAGGGGGLGTSPASPVMEGGNGGGLTGSPGMSYPSYKGGGGGSQSAGGSGGFYGAAAGSLGAGGQGGTNGGGGGGGYYGGGGAEVVSGGGGGSSYAHPTLMTAVVHTPGIQLGNGFVRLTPMGGRPAPALDGSNFVNVPGDNLGNHTATQNLNLAANLLTGGGSTGLRVDASGNVGVGTTSPTQKLEVAGNLQISGAGNGLKFPNGTTQTAAATNQTLALSGLQLSISSGNTVTLPAGADNLGNHSATTTLSMNGNAINFGNTTRQMLNLWGTNYGIGIQNSTQYFRTDAAFAWYNGGVHNDNQFDAGGGSAMMVLNGGRLGLGTTAPAFPLDVQGSVTPANYAYGWFNQNGQAGQATSTGPVSIRASGRILATEFNATSDRRLKSVIGLSNAAQDLALLSRIRITDYTMRDRVQYGTRQFKKVIAQEVEQVFPQAVSQHTGFLPDIYTQAVKTEVEDDSLLRLTLPAAPTTAAQVGQRLKLITKTGEVTATVKAARGNQLLVRGVRQLAGQPVFVFGLEHADVRTVDYEALAMLNVSATQELARKVQALEARNAQLLQQVSQLQTAAGTAQTQTAQLLQTQATQTAELAQRLKALEALLGPRAEAK